MLLTKSHQGKLYYQNTGDRINVSLINILSQKYYRRICNSKDKRLFLYHRSDSIQGIDYIATPVQGFLGQKFKI